MTTVGVKGFTSAANAYTGIYWWLGPRVGSRRYSKNISAFPGDGMGREEK